MYNPLFTPRFAVLLEAYLKGCGEAMLQKFESQVELQMQLEEIGKIVRIKKLLLIFKLFILSRLKSQAVMTPQRCKQYFKIY